MNTAAARNCPHCNQHAPIRLEDVGAICTACGQTRSVFAGTSLDLAGKPQKVGGIAARIAGWLGLALGTFASVTVGGIVAMLGKWLADYPTPGYVIGGVMWLCTLALSIFAIVGGRKLSAAGKSAEQQKQRQAIFALARHKSGVVRASDAATSLGVSRQEADILLTALAGETQTNILVDIDEDGGLLYLFEDGQERRGAAKWQRIEEQAKQRIASDAAASATQEALAEQELQVSEERSRERKH